MIKNNKGVTLVELLIVIVVMGIIAAFSIPAVGTIIENTQKDAILNDALQVEAAAKLYCSSTTTDVGCTTTSGLSWATLKPYVSGIADSDYDFDDSGTNDEIVATITSGVWSVTLEGAGNNVLADKVWEWPAGTPSLLDRDHLEYDIN